MTYVDEILALSKTADVVFVFVSKEDEVDTRVLIERLLQSGKRVVVPKCQNKRLMLACEILSLEECVPSTYGIYEPMECAVVPIEVISLFVVPGTRFDRGGNRVGRGMGYFDRFLTTIKGKRTIVGLCFKHQLVEHIKKQPWDIPVDHIVVAD
jgi:5-formyltetrahydrofolate cyclo-ligase